MTLARAEPNSSLIEYFLELGKQKSFSTQPELFVSASDIDHPKLRSLDDTEVLLERSEIERLLPSIYSSKTGRSSYPRLTLLLIFTGRLLPGTIALQSEP